MYVLQETLLPASGQPASLYLRLRNRQGQGALRLLRDGRGLGLSLDRGEILSTDTLFGSFYTAHWAAHTGLTSLAVVVEFKGRGEVRVLEDSSQPQKVRKRIQPIEQEAGAKTFAAVYEKLGGEVAPALLGRYELDSASGQRFLIPLSPAGLDGGRVRASRIFVEIQALKGSELRAIDFVTEQAPHREVSLSVGIATRNDGDSALEGLLPAVLRLARAEAALRGVYLVNHGPALQGKAGAAAAVEGGGKLHLLEPAPADAPGGLAQTIAAARAAAEPASHHLVLADDVQLDERLIPRALQVLRYARGELMLGGTMLDAQAPGTLVSAGAVIAATGAFRQLGAGSDLGEAQALAMFNAPSPVDLTPWWFCILPLAPDSAMPLLPGPWQRGDDHAYAQALLAGGVAAACLPQVGGWRLAAPSLPASQAGSADLGNRYLPPHEPLGPEDHAASRSAALNVLQSAFFPVEGLPEPLYLRVTPPRPRGGLLPRATPGGGQAIRLDPDDILTTDTYFGAFYRAYWYAYAGLSDVAVAVDLSGAAEVTVFEDHGQGVSVLARMSFRSPVRKRFLIDFVPSILVPTAGQTEARSSRIFVEVTAEAPTDLYGIDFVTWTAPRRRATLSIGLCTFNQEAYFARTLARVARLVESCEAVRAVHVVNQGAAFQNPAIRALLTGPKIRLVEQRNLGGCGGFTRSLAEELAAEEPASHHLMMDDDIVLDERMIARALRFLDYADREIALGAGMLDSMRPNVMYEAGAYLRNDNTIHPYCHNVDMSDPGKLWYFNTPVKTDYNAWWFCILPVERSRELALPAPIFIRGDDFEYGQRLARAGVPTVTLPGIGVWHEPFYAKPTGWQNYYDLRNRLIFAATYSDRVRQLSLAHVLGLITTAILTHNYMTAELRIRAVQDFLRGPRELFATDPEVLHKGVMALAKTDAPEKLDDSWKQIALTEGRKRATSMRGLAVESLYGMLRTGFGPLRRGAAGVMIDADAHPRNTAGRAYILTNGPRSYHLRFVPRRWRMWGLMVRTAALALRYRSGRHAIGAAWAAQIADYRAPSWWSRIFTPASESGAGAGLTAAAAIASPQRSEKS